MEPEMLSPIDVQDDDDREWELRDEDLEHRARACGPVGSIAR